MAAITFVGNLNYVAIAVAGGLRVASGAWMLGCVRAFIPVLTPVHAEPFAARAGHERLAVGRGVGESVRVQISAEPDQSLDRSAAELPAAPRGEVRFEDVSFRYKADVPLIEHLSMVAQPGQTIAIVGPTGASQIRS